MVGTSQFGVLPGLSRRGARRAQVEAVRIAAHHRGAGLGSQSTGWTIEEARRRGCSTVQLTTDARRVEAHRFHERLGFTASHVGVKLTLWNSARRRGGRDPPRLRVPDLGENWFDRDANSPTARSTGCGKLPPGCSAPPWLRQHHRELHGGRLGVRSADDGWNDDDEGPPFALVS